MNVLKISVMIRSSDVIWDYKKKNGHSFWEDVSARLSEKLNAKGLFADAKSSFQHIFYFVSESEADACKAEIDGIVAELLSESGASSSVIVFVGEPAGEELLKIREKNADCEKENPDFWNEANKLIDAGSQEIGKESADKGPAPIIEKAEDDGADTFTAQKAPATAQPQPQPVQIGGFITRMPDAEEKKEEKAAPKEPLTLSECVEKYKNIRETLLKKVRGQRHAVEETVQTLFESEMFASHDEERKGPMATMLFAGPSGVGKTFLASQLKKMTGREMLVVDMSEYSDNLSNGKFNGEHGGPAVVTGFVRNNPNGIILFDEIEKAHINTIHLFLQILDAGRLMDQQLRKEVSFRDTIIIMTTNAGQALYEDSTVCDLSQTPRSVILDALRKDVNPTTKEPCFPECIVTRMANGHVILFNHLEPFALMEIITDEITKQLELFKRSTNLRVDLDAKKLAALVLYSGGGVADARTLRGLAKNILVKELQEVLMQISSKGLDRVNALESVTISVDVGNDEDIKGLFVSRKDMQVAVFADIAGDTFNAANTSFDITADADAFKKRIRGVCDYVIIDPLCGLCASEKTPNDIEDVNSAGMEIFNYMREFSPETPIYILDRARPGFNDFNSLLARGARGILKAGGDGSASLDEALREISLNALINNGAFTLGRAGKTLSFNCAQYIIDDTAAVISFEKLQLRTAHTGGDGNIVAKKGDNNDLRFKDVVGCKNAKKTLAEYAKALDNPREIALKGRKMPKGVLLYGPPGTGKTLLAKAMANECGATFFPVSATSFFNPYVGETERGIRELFKKARKYAPSIIFVDEVDAIGRKRVGSSSTAHNEDALNTFLAEMDGFVNDEKRPVFLLCATNYDIDGDGPRVLDSAFVRRFDSRLLIPLPDTDDRYELILMSLKRHGIHFGENHEKIARNMAERSAGMSNADIETMNTAYARSLEECEPDGAKYMDALDAFRFGDVKDTDPEDLRQTACHEAGHALICRLCGTTPSFLTIVSRGSYGGYMSAKGKERGTYTYSELMNMVCRSLAGRAAEIEVYGDTLGINTGASSDIQHARYYIKACLNDYAMGEHLFIHWKPEEAEALMQEQFDRARKLLRENIAVLNSLTDLLVEKKSLDSTALEEFFTNAGV